MRELQRLENLVGSGVHFGVMGVMERGEASMRTDLRREVEGLAPMTSSAR